MRIVRIVQVTAFTLFENAHQSFHRQTNNMKKSGAERLKESIERKRAQIRERVQRCRAKKGERLRETKRTDRCEKEKDGTSAGPFKHRGEKKRVTDQVREALPVTPEKRAAVLSAVLESPTTRQTLTLHGLVLSPEEQKNVSKP